MKWMRTDEWLPDPKVHGNDYMRVLMMQASDPAPTTGYYVDREHAWSEGEGFYQFNSRCKDVTHWMPFPDPPEVNEHKEERAAGR